jgi:hypothetical protein
MNPTNAIVTMVVAGIIAMTVAFCYDQRHTHITYAEICEKAGGVPLVGMRGSVCVKPDALIEGKGFHL